jgi:hypothetical protein
MVGSLGVETAEGLVSELTKAVHHPLDLGAEGLGLHADDQQEALALLVADFGLALRGERQPTHQLIGQLGALGIAPRSSPQQSDLRRDREADGFDASGPSQSMAAAIVLHRSAWQIGAHR